MREKNIHILYFTEIKHKFSPEQVKLHLKKIGKPFIEVQNGKAFIVNGRVEGDCIEDINALLEELEFVPNSDREKTLAEKINDSLNEAVAKTEKLEKFTLSEFLVERHGFKYNHLASAFKREKKTTILLCFNLLKIQRVKELLPYKTLGDIACIMQYSDVAHLSRKFKQHTGTTISEYRRSVD